MSTPSEEVVKVTAQKIADALNGIEYPVHRHVLNELLQQAKAAGLVIIYGASDDLMEFAGAIADEVGAYEGCTVYLNDNGLLQNECEDDDCPYFKKVRASAATIEAEWAPEDEPDLSWRYKTDIPHVTFNVMEDGVVYCRGIVFALADVTKKTS